MVRVGQDFIRSAVAAGLMLGAASASATEFEPRLTVKAPAEAGQRTVALTFDACSGATDQRILDALLETGAKATVFVTARWLKRNPQALAVLKSRPEQFEIENHGARHLALVTDTSALFHVGSVGTIDGARAEISGGEAAITAATGAKPRWFRGATARYSRDAMDELKAEGYELAGYSLNGDMGASLPAASVEKRISAAKSGDVVIAHINQPTHASGAGVAAAIRSLKAAGVTFVRLDQAEPVHADGPPLSRPHDDVKNELHVQRDDHGGDKGGEGGHPAGSDELAHPGPAAGEPHERNDGEGQLKAQHDLTQHQ